MWLRFHDDLTGEIDFQSELWGPVFEPPKDVRVFAKLRGDPELETLARENGADLAPEFLCKRVKAAKLAAAE